MTTPVVEKIRPQTVERPPELPPPKIDHFSLIDLDIAARGVAQVIVFLKAPGPAAGAALGARSAGYKSAASDVMACFTDAPTSHNAALQHEQMPVTTARLAVAKKRSSTPPGRLFPRLGVMLGNVDRKGLEDLERHGAVAKVMATPPLRLIHPRNIAAADAPKTLTWGLKRLGVKQLWTKGFGGGGVLVGHLDTGADGKHPAIKPALAQFAEFDNLGVLVDPSPAAFDSDEHGTHTAGTIAGRTIKGAAIGVAPEAMLASAMVIEGGNVVARVLGGFDWAIGQSVRIISMSLGFQGFHTFFSDIFTVLRSNEILPVIAVGNEGPGTSRSPGNYAESLSVGAMDKNGRMADFSGSQRFVRTDDPLVPDVVAPGVGVISAKPGKAYQSMDGSSMATPHVAGLAAVLMSAFPAATADQVEAAIFGSCTRTPSMAVDRANRGVPDAVKAFDLLKDAVS